MVDTTGFGFRPTDDELVGYYLHKKIMGMTSLVEKVITEINLYNFDPWDLRFQSKLKLRNPVWYFFVEKGNKCGNGDGESRRTSSGFWKITGKAVNIKDRWGFWSGNQGKIGHKKCLVFHKDKNFNMGKKEWVMHEYHSTILPENQRTHVICRVEYVGDDITFLPHYAIINPSLASLYDITGRGERKEARKEEGTEGRRERRS